MEIVPSIALVTSPPELVTIMSKKYVVAASADVSLGDSVNPK
jgi:hypothetical protein